MGKHIIDLETWNRKEHFEFFSSYDEPFFGIVAEVDCTQAYATAKNQGYSFFAYYLHCSTAAVNEVKEFRCRIQEDKVVCYDSIHAGTTIGRDDGTFSFSFTLFSEDFEAFSKDLRQEIEAVRNSTGLRFNEDAMRDDMIHYSTFPWRNFTGLTHARNFKFKDSTPKITFGKAYLKDGKRMLPVSVNAHHALVDGLHVAQYFEAFENLLNE